MQPENVAWLKTTLTAYKIRRVGLLAALDPETMPPLTVEGVPLTEREIGGLLGAFKTGDTSLITKIAAVLHEHGDPEELFTFALRLFTTWETLPLYKPNNPQQNIFTLQAAQIRNIERVAVAPIINVQILARRTYQFSPASKRAAEADLLMKLLQSYVLRKTR